MPEGHLLHRYARDHRARLAGEPLEVTSPQGRFAAASALSGRVLEGAEAWGKNLFHEWDDGSVVHVHLGQTGLFVHFEPPAPPPRPQVRMRLAGSRLVADLIAPLRCDRIGRTERDAIVRKLGPDPLREDARPERFFAALEGRRSAIGALLLDQSVIAGVGNVLRAEALFALGISPARAAGDLSRSQTQALWTTLVSLMRRAVEDGRILPHVEADADRASVPEQETRMVYRQQACRRCATAVRTASIGGRTAYVCPQCQPE